MRTLFDAVNRHAAAAGDAVAVSDDHGELSRRELVGRVADLAAELKTRPRTVGILAPNGIDWAIAQLAGAFAGKIVVPLPTFFSPAQLGHIVRDAAVEVILATEDTMPMALQSGVGALLLDGHRGTARPPELIPEPLDGFGQIIYTSGSTGQPKGVRHLSGQMAWSTFALATATKAGETDSYLSVLPLPLLLETLCAVFIPAWLGARVHFEIGLAGRIGRGDATGIAKAFEAHRPTMGMVVPQLLKQWVGELHATGRSAPASLRFVAAGGAPVPAQVAEAAWKLGIPVHEGYGLSECCSVVALNRPHERRSGTVGRPLDGLDVSIDGGEIVVDGPSVTDGYLGQGAAQRPWRTGDLGTIDQDGLLTVHGRKDNLIVTSFGRNVSPEWIETMILGDPRIAFCAVLGHGEPHLTALLIPSRHAAGWFAGAGEAEVLALLAQCCSGAPGYAVPRAAVVVSLEEALASRLLSNGRPSRRPIDAFIKARASSTVTAAC